MVGRASHGTSHRRRVSWFQGIGTARRRWRWRLDHTWVGPPLPLPTAAPPRTGEARLCHRRRTVLRTGRTCCRRTLSPPPPPPTSVGRRHGEDGARQRRHPGRDRGGEQGNGGWACGGASGRARSWRAEWGRVAAVCGPGHPPRPRVTCMCAHPRRPDGPRPPSPSLFKNH